MARPLHIVSDTIDMRMVNAGVIVGLHRNLSFSLRLGRSITLICADICICPSIISWFPNNITINFFNSSETQTKAYESSFVCLSGNDWFFGESTPTPQCQHRYNYLQQRDMGSKQSMRNSFWFDCAAASMLSEIEQQRTDSWALVVCVCVYCSTLMTCVLFVPINWVLIARRVIHYW